MIFFIDNGGTIINSVPSPVYQGAANANDIYLIAPFAENMVATVSFKLPNGVYRGPYSMAEKGEIPGLINKETQQPYSGWSYTMPNNILQYYGTVIAQFYFYAADSNRVAATSVVSFIVERGVPADLPAEPSPDVYQDILSNITKLQSDLKSGFYTARAIYAWNSEYTYGANELVFYPDQGEYGVLLKSLVANNTTPPYNDGVLNSQEWKLEVDFNALNELLEIQSVVEGLAQDAQASADDAKDSALAAVTAKDLAHSYARATEQYMASAENSAFLAGSSERNARASAQSAQQALNEFKNDTRIEEIQENIETIESYIPSTTSPENQLADKGFVNSSINNIAAFYITYNAQGDAFPTRESLLNATTYYYGGEVRTPTQNDYAIVLADESQPKGADGTYPTTRYSYQGSTWSFQYVVNNTSFTQAQVDAINSGITKELVEKISENTVDDELSKTSTNPVQNKVITEALEGYLPKLGRDDEDYGAYAKYSDDGQAFLFGAKIDDGMRTFVTTNSDGMDILSYDASEDGGEHAIHSLKYDGASFGGENRPNYNGADLALVSEVTVKYTKPSGGIPESDLSADVQQKLNSDGGGVTSVNGKTGAVELAASDVGAEPEFTKNTAFNKDFGTAAGTVCQGNDTRLSNSRTPTSHASSLTTYGVGTTTNYGHVKLSNNQGTNSTTQTKADNSTGQALAYSYHDVRTINLNNYRSEGQFTFNNVTTRTNFPTAATVPTNLCYHLEVKRFSSTTAVCQVLYVSGTTEVWIRYSTSATEWSNWIETYSKPITGIPESDLSADVQQKLNSGGGGGGSSEEFFVGTPDEIIEHLNNATAPEEFLPVIKNCAMRNPMLSENEVYPFQNLHTVNRYNNGMWSSEVLLQVIDFGIHNYGLPDMNPNNIPYQWAANRRQVKYVLSYDANYGSGWEYKVLTNKKRIRMGAVSIINGQNFVSAYNTALSGLDSMTYGNWVAGVSLENMLDYSNAVANETFNGQMYNSFCNGPKGVTTPATVNIYAKGNGGPDLYPIVTLKASILWASAVSGAGNAPVLLFELEGAKALAEVSAGLGIVSGSSTEYLANILDQFASQADYDTVFEVDFGDIWLEHTDTVIE